MKKILLALALTLTAVPVSAETINQMRARLGDTFEPVRKTACYTIEDTETVRYCYMFRWQGALFNAIVPMPSLDVDMEVIYTYDESGIFADQVKPENFFPNVYNIDDTI